MHNVENAGIFFFLHIEFVNFFKTPAFLGLKAHEIPSFIVHQLLERNIIK